MNYIVMEDGVHMYDIIHEEKGRYDNILILQASQSGNWSESIKGTHLLALLSDKDNYYFTGPGAKQIVSNIIDASVLYEMRILLTVYEHISTGIKTETKIYPTTAIITL